MQAAGIDRSTVNKTLSPTVNYNATMEDLILRTAKEMGYNFKKLELRSLAKHIQDLTVAVNKLRKKKNVPKNEVKDLVKEVKNLKRFIAE